MHNLPNARPWAEVTANIKEEIKDFTQIRVQLFKTEFGQKLALLKVAGILAVVAVVFLLTAYLFLAIGIASLIAAAFLDHPYRWVYGFFGVALLWGLMGGIAAYVAKREIALKGIVPRRTLEVLKGDKIWLQSEAKEHYEGKSCRRAGDSSPTTAKRLP
jgi:Putative Actinobacterial Holin-X, holin superfamily III